MEENVEPVVKKITIMVFSQEDSDALMEEINDLLPIMGIHADILCETVKAEEVSNGSQN